MGIFDIFGGPKKDGVRVVSAVGSTAHPEGRGVRGKTIEAAMTKASLDYLAEIQAYNDALKPADFVDEHGEKVTGFVDPKRFKSVDNDELLARKFAARADAKKALSGNT